MSNKFTQGAAYKRAEILEIILGEKTNPSMSGYRNCGDYILLFTNIGKDGSINGKKFSYENKFVNKNNITWFGKNGESHRKTKLLRSIYNKEKPILIFVADENTKKTFYKYWGQVKGISFVEAHYNSGKIVEEFIISRDKEFPNPVMPIVEYVESHGINKGLLGFEAEKQFQRECWDGDKEITFKTGVNGVESLIWNYRLNKRFEDHDFKLGDYFIEVKATTQKSDTFFLSEREYKLMEENKDKYLIVLYTDFYGNCTRKIFNPDEIENNFSVDKKIQRRYYT